MVKKQPKYFEDWFEIGTYDTEGKARQVRATKKRTNVGPFSEKGQRYVIRKAARKHPSGMWKGGFTLWGINRIANIFHPDYKGRK